MKLTSCDIDKNKPKLMGTILSVECVIHNFRRVTGSMVLPRRGFSFIIKEEDIDNVKSSIELQLKALNIPLLRITHDQKIEIIEKQIWEKKNILEHIAKNKEKIEYQKIQGNY